MTSMDHPKTAANPTRHALRETQARDPLPRLLSQLVARAGEPSCILRATSRPWASALFQGRRHVIVLHLDGDDAPDRLARFAEGLDDAEWTLQRHFVADITIDDRTPHPEGGMWVELSALTIEDW